MTDRIVCWFSCGAASAVATKMAIQENAGALPLVVARCIVREEHPDNDRFAAECEKWFGVPITNLLNEDYNGSTYEVFKKAKYISGVAGAPCSRRLKKWVREAFQHPRDKHVFGYTADEADRLDSFLDHNPIDVSAPLIEKGVTHADCLALLVKLGIELPVMYKMGYKHNNCIGCVKSTGAGYWNKIRIDFPEEFDRMAKFSKSFGVKLIKVGPERVFLEDLAPNTGNYKAEPEVQCGIFCETVAEAIK